MFGIVGAFTCRSSRILARDRAGASPNQRRPALSRPREFYQNLCRIRFSVHAAKFRRRRNHERSWVYDLSLKNYLTLTLVMNLAKCSS